MNQGFPDTSLLAFRQYRHRAKTIPVMTTVRNANRRESYMAYHFAFNLRDQ